MKTVGELLKLARRAHHLSVEEVAEATRIKAEFIRALDANDYHALPESTFVKGFIRNYALAVHQDPERLLAVFRRDFGENERGKVVPRSFLKPLHASPFRWTPKATTIAALSALLTAFFVYLVFQFRLLTGVPSVTLEAPTENQVVSSSVVIEGKTQPQATVTVNHQPVTVEDDGRFTYTLNISQGTHTITVEATSRTGKRTTLQRTVIVQ